MSDPRPRSPHDAQTTRRHRKQPAWAAYALAAASVAASAALTFALRLAASAQNARVIFAFFYVAIFVAVWFGGRGPGLFAVALSALVADIFFLPGALLAPDFSGLIPNAFFVGISLIAVLLIERSRHAEASAQVSRESLETTLRSIGDAVISTDAAGRVVFMNAVAERLTSWPLEDALSRPLAEVFHIVNEETRREVESPVEKVLREGYVVGLANHTVLVARDGSETPIDDSGAPIHDEEGRIRGVVLVFHDITERRRAEQILRESEQRARLLAAIVESSDDAVIGKTLEGVVTSWNAAAERMYGYTSEEAVGRHISFIVPPELSGELQEIMSRLSRGERVEHLRTVRVRKDGQRLDASVTISPILDSSGQWVGASTIARNITEQKRTEERLRFVAEASRTLASSLDYEATLERLARLSVAALADYCLIDLVGDDGSVRRVAASHRDAALQPLVERLRDFPPGPQPAGVPQVLRTGQPEAFPDVTDELFPSLARDKEHEAILRELGLKSFLTVPLVARERTIGALTLSSTRERREYTSEDIAFAQEIANRAALAIENARLYKRAQEVNRAKDEFLATLSHELRTPLTPVLGWTHMIRSGLLNEAETAQGIKTIEKNSQSLSRLINDLLDMSSILSGKMRIERAPVELSSVVREAVETVRPLADARRVALEVETGGLSPVVSGDRTRLVQVFWNLLNNGVKFSREGGRVHVRFESANGAARISVEDEGEGIAPEFLPHVFERFRQADMGTTRQHGGLGIGLALVKSFVEAHGGTVAASSGGEQRGSVFTVTLPALSAASSSARASVESEAERAQPHSAEPLRVLLIEDARDTLDMLRIAFEARGYVATACESSEEALRVAEAERFDIIVSDIGLPHIDGYELLGRLRRLPHLRGVPALALTGYARQRDAEAALEAGFDAHVPKPVDPSALAEQVGRLVARGTRGGQ